jgi:hypothetical protein
MTGKTTAVLALVAAIMAAFIVFYERGITTSQKLNERSGRIFPVFVRERVNRIEIERKGTTLVLTRVPEPGEIELGEWIVERPFSAKADPEVVDKATGALEWLDARRQFERITDADRKRFGFHKPALRGWYTLDKKRVAFVVGQRDPLGQGYYLQTDDPSIAYVVGKDFVETFDRNPSDFHTKALHEIITAPTTASLTLRDEEGERVIDKRGQDFWLTKPEVAIASRSVVEDLIRQIDALKATQFLTQATGDLAKYGLETPVFEVVVRETAKKGGIPAVAFDLRVGSHCGERQGESYVWTGAGIVACAADQALSKIRDAAPKLRDKRLLTLEDNAIKSVQIREGERTITLRKPESRWSYQAAVSEKAVAAGEADMTAVTEWFNALRSVKAESFLAAEPAVLRAKGIASPRVVLTLERTEGNQKDLITVGVRENYQLYIKRGDEPAIGAFPGSANALLSAAYYRFRNLQLLDEDESELYKIDVARSSTTETLVKHGEQWRIDKPVQAESDPESLSEVTRLFTKLKAVRFVADEPAPNHGLDKPVAVFTGYYHRKESEAKKNKGDKSGVKETFSHERAITVKVGAPTEGGCFAQFENDPVVFVIGSALAEPIISPLANRSMLTTPLQQIQRIRLVRRGEPSIEILRRGEDEWVATDKKITRARAKRIAETVATLKASSVSGYGSASFLEGMNFPRVRIFVVRKSDAPPPASYEITIGNEALRGPAGSRVYARRTGTPVSFTIPAKTAREFLD